MTVARFSSPILSTTNLTCKRKFLSPTQKKTTRMLTYFVTATKIFVSLSGQFVGPIRRRHIGRCEQCLRQCYTVMLVDIVDLRNLCGTV